MYRGDMLRYLVTNSEARFAVISRALSRPAGRHRAVSSGGSKPSIVPDADRRPARPAAFAWSGRASFFDGVEPPSTSPGPEYFDIASMIYTSGTTGPSKGVLVPWAELFEFVRMPPDDFIGPDGGGYYTMYPAFHVSGKSSLYMSARAHGHIVLRETFSLTEFWNDIRRFDVTAAGLVGPMAALLLLAEPQPDDADNPLDKIYVGPAHPAGRGVQGALRHHAGRHRLRHDRDRRADPSDGFSPREHHELRSTPYRSAGLRGAGRRRARRGGRAGRGRRARRARRASRG